RIAVIGLVGDHAHGLLPRSPGTMGSTYADGRERRFREPDFRRGGRVKVVSQRKTAAVDHHHPLRPLAPLGFSVSSTSKDAERSPAGPASEHRSAGSTESLPTRDGSRSTDGRPCGAWAVWGA